MERRIKVGPESFRRGKACLCQRPRFWDQPKKLFSEIKARDSKHGRMIPSAKSIWKLFILGWIICYDSNFKL